jgi:hypothetical protein
VAVPDGIGTGSRRGIGDDDRLTSALFGLIALGDTETTLPQSAQWTFVMRTLWTKSDRSYRVKDTTGARKVETYQIQTQHTRAGGVSLQKDRRDQKFSINSVLK